MDPAVCIAASKGKSSLPAIDTSFLQFRNPKGQRSHEVIPAGQIPIPNLHRQPPVFVWFFQLAVGGNKGRYQGLQWFLNQIKQTKGQDPKVGIFKDYKLLQKYTFCFHPRELPREEELFLFESLWLKQAEGPGQLWEGQF